MVISHPSDNNIITIIIESQLQHTTLKALTYIIENITWTTQWSFYYPFIFKVSGLE